MILNAMTTSYYISSCKLHLNTVQQEAFEGENFHELLKNTIFAEKLSQIAHFWCTEGRHTPNFAEKTFAYSRKTIKFAKVFSLEIFPLIWWPGVQC